MSEFSGFDKCEEKVKTSSKMGKWDTALNEFMASGIELACKEYESKESARKAASGFHQRKRDYNWRHEYLPRLKEANEKGAEEFLFPIVEVRADGTRIYLKRTIRKATKNDRAWDSKAKKWDKPCFPWRSYEFMEKTEVVADGD